ncbi:peptide MFS transporter [Citricoccus sp. GCM10030269]|uniref:peptide MFS transporter n=1 Tax=Citricoccus sp. GCM10030269 TaxID=3273388 RepID=UPI0036219122
MGGAGDPGLTHVAETTSPDSSEHEHNPSGRTFFGQPGPLANLFSVEMWERFSFYGMQGILLIYMYFQTTDGGLGIDEGVATGIVGAYGGMVYVFCILGGWVADRLLGSERTMFYSAVLIMCGHIALALVPAIPGLVLGLVLVAVGSGGLKANVANLVGHLYSREDPRRDAGFSLFYMGVNIGGLFGPLLTGWVQQTWGFHLGFGLAAIGMAVGLTQYWVRRKDLPDDVHAVPDPLPRSQYPRWVLMAVAGLVVIGVLLGTGVVNAANLADVVVILAAVAAVGIFAFLLVSSKVQGVERSRVIAFIPLFIGSSAFFALFQQQFTVITLYSDTRLDRNLFGWEMPIPWVQSINPVFIILFAPVFAWLWTRMGKRQPNTPVKFAIGIALMGAAFLLFLPMVSTAAVPVLWIALILFAATMGELLVSPVGLSLSTKLAPVNYPVLMVALYNLSVALGTALAGSLAGFYTAENEGAYFGVLGAVTIAIGVVMLIVSKPVHRAMRGVD